MRCRMAASSTRPAPPREVFALPDFCHLPYFEFLDDAFRDLFEFHKFVDREKGFESLNGLLISLPSRISELVNRDTPLYLCLEGIG